MKRSLSPAEALEVIPDSSIPSHTSKKLKLAPSSASPFPHHLHPTAQECHDAHVLLVKSHGPRIRQVPSTSQNSAATCGGVPNVIESIIATILSQNTTGANSARAMQNLYLTFGRNNFEALAAAPQSMIVEAIKTGGLASKKSKNIQSLLHSVKEKHGEYSLQHLATPPSSSKLPLPNKEIMEELMSYDGVGPKTASCVLLFCLGRESFAVDTHVFRLSKLLGWVPPKANRISAQAHLELHVPAELKYPLHVLMIDHGRACRGCKDRGSGPCILKEYLARNKTSNSEPN